jgi:hypothetical protein
MKAGGNVMMRAQRWALILGLGLMATTNGAAAAKSYPATLVDTNLVISIQVDNDAKVDHKTLAEAEALTTEIFRKVGVEARWIDGWDKQHPDLVEDGSSDLNHLALSLFSEPISDRFQLANEIMGLAPGGGPDRYHVYVFFDRIWRFNGVPAMAWLDGTTYLRPSHTLGYAIAHEFGHLLLNMEGHSESGVMRGHWTHRDLQQIASGRLSFTPEQAEAIRAEVARRGHHLPENELASNSSNIN